MYIFYKNLFKKIILFIFLLSFIFLFSCSSESKTLYSVKLFTIDKKIIDKRDFDPYKLYNLSLIKYRQYFIYFYDKEGKTFYKFTKTGDQILKIDNINIDDVLTKINNSQNNNQTNEQNNINSSNNNNENNKNNNESNYNNSKDLNRSYLLPLEKDFITTKIIRSFPFPEVYDFYIDFEGNIIFKVSISNPKLIDTLYYSSDIRKIYIFENESPLKEIYSTVNEQQSSYIFFLKFNKFGDLNSIIFNSKTEPFFPYLTNINILKNNSLVLSSLIPNSPNYDLYLQSLSFYQFVLTDSNFKLLNTLSFSNINIPLSKIEKELSYQYFIINYFIDYLGNIYFYTSFYEKFLPVYSKIYLIENFNLENIKIFYVKNLVEIDKNTNQKYVIPEDLPFGTDEYSNIFFIVKLLNKPNYMRLSIINKEKKLIFKSNIKTDLIFSESQFSIGEDGCLIAYSQTKDKYEIFYWGTDIIVKRNSQK